MNKPDFPDAEFSEQLAEKTLTETPQPTPEATEKTDEPEAVADGSDAASAQTDAKHEETTLETLSKDELLERLSAIAQLPADEISREGVSRLKQLFHAARNKEIETEKAAFVEAGNDAAAFEAAVDPLEDKFQSVLAEIKEKKARLAAEQEAVRQENLAKKNEIIETLAEMSADTDNVNRHFTRFKELQQEFKEIGEVPPTEATSVWKRYQEGVERFYDQLKINKDLRDYDFKKNYDTKLLLCDEAEKLMEEPDVITAFKRLQDLHDKWRETGPVAKEMRDEIWNRFKDASAEVNKKYQAFFEERKARERQNELAKTEICERVEAIDFSQVKSYAAWEDLTKQILKAQEDWKKLGFASKKLNNALFARLRETCDKFFAAKADYFKSMKDELAANLAKKIALCEKAESLKDSTDWRATTDALVALQKEWKTIGSVPKKHSDSVWRRFLEACDHFFEQKKKNSNDTRSVELANLKQKKEIIAALRSIDPESTPREDAIAKIKELSAKWQQIGHVPFRDKDKVYDAYRELTSSLHSAYNMKQSREAMNRFESSIDEMAGDEIKLLRERERMLRAYEQRRSELHTYENNLGFFNSKSKSGDSMLRDLQRRIERIKDDLKALEEKIKLIDAKL